MNHPRTFLLAEFDDVAYVNRRWFYESEWQYAQTYVDRITETRSIKGKLIPVTATESKQMKTKLIIITVFKAKGGFRWHMKRAGRIIAESGEGYKRHGSCFKTLKNLLDGIAGCRYEFELPK